MSKKTNEAHEMLGRYLAYQNDARLALRRAVEAADETVRATALALADESHAMATKALEWARDAMRGED